MQNWDDLRFFLAVARTGTVSAAAQDLAVNQSTVSRRINAFEEELDVRLFERLTTGYELTPEGEELLRRTLTIEEETHAIDRRLMGRNVELTGPIRVTTSPMVAHYLVMPLLQEFQMLHPGIMLWLDLSDNLYNLTAREADVAIRVTRDTVPENLIGRELGNIEYGVYGEKRFLADWQKPKHRQALNWIGEDNNDPRPSWLPARLNKLHLVMRSNNVQMSLDAARLGMGVVRLPVFMGKNEKSLKRLQLDHPIAAAPLWLLTHVELRRVARVSVFNNFMVSALRKKLNYDA